MPVLCPHATQGPRPADKKRPSKTGPRGLEHQPLSLLPANRARVKLKLQTDYALRVLLYLGFVGRQATSDEIAEAHAISKDHLVKVVQQLARLGMVRTTAGRKGGITLLSDPTRLTVRTVVEAFQGKKGVLDCVRDPSVCRMEPGCQLRVLLMEAEEAFYRSLEQKTIGELSDSARPDGGLYNLKIQPNEDPA